MNFNPETVKYTNIFYCLGLGHPEIPVEWLCVCWGGGGGFVVIESICDGVNNFNFIIYSRFYDCRNDGQVILMPDTHPRGRDSMPFCDVLLDFGRPI